MRYLALTHLQYAYDCRRNSSQGPQAYLNRYAATNPSWHKRTQMSNFYGCSAPLLQQRLPVLDGGQRNMPEKITTPRTMVPSSHRSIRLPFRANK